MSVLPAAKPCVRQQLHRAAGQALALAGVETLTVTCCGVDLLAGARPAVSTQIGLSTFAGSGFIVAFQPQTAAEPQQHAEHQQGDRRPHGLGHQPSIGCTRACRTWRCCSAARRARCRPSSR